MKIRKLGYDPAIVPFFQRMMNEGKKKSYETIRKRLLVLQYGAEEQDIEQLLDFPPLYHVDMSYLDFQNIDEGIKYIIYFEMDDEAVRIIQIFQEDED